MKDLSGPCQVYVFFVKFRPSSVNSLPGPSGALPSRLSASWFVMRPLSSSTARASSAFTARVYLIKAAYWNPATASTTTRTMRPMRFRAGETFFLGEPVFSAGEGLGSDMAISVRWQTARDAAAKTTAGLAKMFPPNGVTAPDGRSKVHPRADSLRSSHGDPVKQSGEPRATTIRADPAAARRNSLPLRRKADQHAVRRSGVPARTGAAIAASITETGCARAIQDAPLNSVRSLRPTASPPNAGYAWTSLQQFAAYASPRAACHVFVETNFLLLLPHAEQTAQRRTVP